jgi:hypothetical protein
MFEAALGEGGWDVVLSDFSLPSCTGMEVLEALNATGEDIPFILWSGAIGEDLAAEAMRRGAKDFVRKDRLDRLLPAIERELADRDVRRRHREAEQALRESERRFSQISGLMGELIWEVDAEGVYTYLSPACASLLGHDETDIIGKLHFYDLHPPEGREAFKASAFETFARKGRIQELPNPMLTKDGRILEVITNGVPILAADGTLRGYRGADQDVTERRRAEEERRSLEAQLYQSQRLESLGLLAGGVAHDINNVLAAVLSLAEAHRAKLDADHPLAGALETIARACTRGRDVVKDLLYFARKEVELTRAVDLNALVKDLVQLLGRTTLMRVQIQTDLEAHLPPIQGDPGALSNVLMNLCMNAVDAMREGGTLLIRTRSCEGECVRVSVRDTGEGMSPEVLKRAIEPFFTTKAPGKGTGLGLSMVYGAMKAHGGNLDIQSEPGQGTEVVLRFPLTVSLPPADPGVSELSADPGQAGTPGALTVLLVDDDELIRMSVAPMLEMLGHQVETAEGGMEALARLEAGPAVDLVILDMNMPGLSGAQTLPRILALQPHQAVLVASGYRDEESHHLLKGRPNLASIQKPFTLEEIRTKVSSLMARVADAKHLG